MTMFFCPGVGWRLIGPLVSVIETCSVVFQTAVRRALS